MPLSTWYVSAAWLSGLLIQYVAWTGPAAREDDTPSLVPPMTEPASEDDFTSQIFGTLDPGNACEVGSFGMVHRRTIQSSKGTMEVAVKVFHINPGGELERIKRGISRELKVWLRLKHPTIVPLLGTAKVDSPFPALVSQWMPSGTLYVYLEVSTTLTDSAKVGLARGIAEGLNYLHSVNIVHGDLHPRNVLIDGSGSPRLIDFGLAAVPGDADLQLSTMTMTGNLDARWRAPEVIGIEHDPERPTFKSDIYSFGGTMFFIISGDVPWKEKKHSHQITIDLSRKTTPARPDKILDNHWNIIQQCWSWNPWDRPRAAEVIINLQAQRQVTKIFQDNHILGTKSTTIVRESSVGKTRIKETSISASENTNLQPQSQVVKTSPDDHSVRGASKETSTPEMAASGGTNLQLQRQVAKISPNDHSVREKRIKKTFIPASENTDLQPQSQVAKISPNNHNVREKIIKETSIPASGSTNRQLQSQVTKISPDDRSVGRTRIEDTSIPANGGTNLQPQRQVAKISPNDHSVRKTRIKKTSIPASVRKQKVIVVFGEMGAGNNSLVNLMAGKEAARTYPQQGCTMSWTEYIIGFDGDSYKVFDTIGLEEQQMGIKEYLESVEEAYKLVKELDRHGGIDLLLFCVRSAVKFTATIQTNYRLFHEFLCEKKVPIVLAITDLEREERMEDWWVRNQITFDKYRIQVAGHACITSADRLDGRHRNLYEESRITIRNLVKQHTADGQKQAWIGGDALFVSFMRRLKELLVGGSHVRRKDIVPCLTKHCGISGDVAKQLADLIKQD